MSPRLLRALCSALVASAACVSACGGRGEPTARDKSLWTPLPVRAGDAGSDYCLTPTDCASTDRCNPRRCVDYTCVAEPVTCDDGDRCTEDSCDPANGECRFVALTQDRDSDGFPSPRRGFSRLDPDACGTDCDDTSARSFPGNQEVCDGLDNDCDGVVDNGARFIANPSRVIALTNGARTASLGGIAYSDAGYGAVFSQQVGVARNKQNTFANILPDRLEAPMSIPIALVPSDSFAGPIVWTGQVFATAWEDRRDDDYEIYFNRLSSSGEKLDPDRRLTHAPGFSLRPSLAFDGNAEFRVAWEDRREMSGVSVIYGQRVGLSGDSIAENVALTPSEIESRSPALASGIQRLGMAFLVLGGDRRVAFRGFAHDLTDGGGIVPLSGPGGASPSIVYNPQGDGGRFVVAWHTEGEDTLPGPVIRGSVLSENGEVLVADRALTVPGDFVRSHALLPLGDRLMLFWAQSVGGHYNIFVRELSPELEPLSEATAVTEVETAAYNPALAVGRDGQIGILFSAISRELGTPQVFFTSLSCVAATQP